MTIAAATSRGFAADPIELELFRNGLMAIADEMALTIVRTAFSSVLRDNMDFSTALMDAGGRVVAQGLTLAGHLGSMPGAMASIMSSFGDDIHPDDVFILNDPYNGGMHLPDIFVIQPIFLGEHRLGFAATVCHHVDVGGRIAGSNAADSTEIYQEGLRIPPLKLVERGRRNVTLDALITCNVRLPDRVLGDIAAQLAACHTAESQLCALAARVGLGRLAPLMDATCDYTETLARAAVARLRDGICSFTDMIDDDGIERGKPIALTVTVTKRGDAIKIDWAGSSPQVKGAINSTLSFTKAASYCAVCSILDEDIPCNDGFFRVVEVVAPPGTVTNVVAPGACAARGLTGFRMLDALFGALAQMLPETVYAASDGGATGVSIGGYRSDRSPFVYVEFISASWGGRPYEDGVDGVSNPLSNVSLPSAEMIESEQPIRILACEFICDRGGPGRFRGGTAIGRTYQVLEDDVTLQVRSDRRDFRPYGLQGGSTGAPSYNRICRDGQCTDVPSKLTTHLRRNDIFRHETAGAGGWGDPLDRSPDRVAHDVANGIVSPGAAKADYGVVLDAAGRVDPAATDAERASRRTGAVRNPGGEQAR